MRFLDETFRVAMSGPIAEAFVVAPGADNDVPDRVKGHFTKWDTNGDGFLSQEELDAALGAAFPQMPPWAKEHVPAQFAKYAKARSEGGPPLLDQPAFTKLFAAFLFRNFDANGDGVLDHAEAQAALTYLADGRPITVAIPASASSAAGVSKAEFWAMYKAMLA